MGTAAAPTPGGISAGRIRLLSEATINRIAAGEVIERPAAAARELVENALDAGAGRISVAIDGGGIDRIEVSDDGSGMAAAELALAVQRHATSKLTDDMLVRIATLGFRGEALPSIGAAARLSIVSRPPDADHASGLRVEGGVVGEVGPAAGGVGTRVTVRDLFFATPARRKFLKSPRAEADATEAVIRRLALAAPHVAMRLESDGRVLFDLPVQDRAARIAALLGPEAAAALLPVNGERDGIVLTGFACAATVTRATAAGQALMVNGRPVTDPVLRTAVRVAYRDVIAPGRHALVALFLDVPVEEVDVNVHPAKAEVRFRAPDAVRALVIGTLGRTLAAGAGLVAPSIGSCRSTSGRVQPISRFRHAVAPRTAPAGSVTHAQRKSGPRGPRRHGGSAAGAGGRAVGPRSGAAIAGPVRHAPAATSTRWARRWRRCSIPTLSPWLAMAAWCWWTSTPRMSG